MGCKYINTVNDNYLYIGLAICCYFVKLQVLENFVNGTAVGF